MSYCTHGLRSFYLGPQKARYIGEQETLNWTRKTSLFAYRKWHQGICPACLCGRYFMSSRKIKRNVMGSYALDIMHSIISPSMTVLVIDLPLPLSHDL